MALRWALLALPVVLLPLSLLFAEEEMGPRLAQVVSPDKAGMDAAKLMAADKAIEAAIARRELPGAVLLVLRQGKIVCRKAYGLRSREPLQLAMTVETVFDLASLTKPIATATCLMLLLEQGKLRLSDPIDRYLPVPSSRKKKITLEHLLLHTSGLPAGNPFQDYHDGKDRAIERILELELVAEPGTKFLYSDLGYILLGEIVEKVGGEPLDVFARKHIFAPLGMQHTTFKPGPDLAKRAAPTEKRDGQWIQGQVHDPRAHLLGGIAGHAGLFATADDLAVYAQMLLNGGRFGGKRLLSPLTVRQMTRPRPVPGGQRALGWDVQTTFSSNRGELFPIGGFGHTGFTGASIWIDPGSQTVVTLLSNRVHPNGKGNVVRLRSQVATLVAASIVQPPLGE
jgi:CubicO group peptidase (beta-lactamase class C family)